MALLALVRTRLFYKNEGGGRTLMLTLVWLLAVASAALPVYFRFLGEQLCFEAGKILISYTCRISFSDLTDSYS